MKISRFNHEGYPDPTVFAAFTNIEAELRKARFRPIVYVCSPYSGDIDANILNARRYCRFAVDSGCIPIAPHLLFPQFMNDADETERNRHTARKSGTDRSRRRGTSRQDRRRPLHRSAGSG